MQSRPVIAREIAANVLAIQGLNDLDLDLARRLGTAWLLFSRHVHQGVKLFTLEDICLNDGFSSTHRRSAVDR